MLQLPAGIDEADEVPPRDEGLNGSQTRDDGGNKVARETLNLSMKDVAYPATCV